MKKIGILLSVMCYVYICAGCNVDTELTKEEAFKDVIEVANSQEIHINFTYKDKDKNRKMHKFDVYTLGIEMTSKWGEQRIPMVDFSPDNSMLGLYIKAEGNIWEIDDLYHQDHLPIWGEADLEEKKQTEKDAELREIYQNAEWELEPLRDDFNFWIEDFMDIPEEEILSNDKKTELFNVVDKVTGAKFTLSLIDISIVSEAMPEPEIIY